MCVCVCVKNNNNRNPNVDYDINIAMTMILIKLTIYFFIYKIIHCKIKVNKEELFLSISDCITLKFCLFTFSSDVL